MALGDAIDNLAVERGWDRALKDAEVVARFGDIVGPDIAAHASVASFEDGMLSVQATDSAWATQLRLLSPQLLARLADALGPNTVSSIQIFGPAAPRRGRRRFKPIQ
jgi:predicted nucleic acid-binding Zn ribbon protein